MGPGVRRVGAASSDQSCRTVVDRRPPVITAGSSSSRDPRTESKLSVRSTRSEGVCLEDWHCLVMGDVAWDRLRRSFRDAYQEFVERG